MDSVLECAGEFMIYRGKPHAAPAPRALLELLESRRLLAALQPLDPALPGEFLSSAVLSQPREGLTEISAGGDALFAGGVTYTAERHPLLSDVVDIFNSRTGQWSTAHLSQPREFLASIAVGTKVLFTGGFSDLTSNSSSRAVDVYDTATNAWTHGTLSALNSVARVVGDKVVFFGGTTGGATPQPAAAEIYDGVTGAWTTAPISTARDGEAASVVGHRLLIAGGWTVAPDGSHTPSALVNVYDADTNAWSTASLSTPRGRLAAGSVGSLALFAGGFVSEGGSTPRVASDVIDLYDAATGLWSTHPIGGAPGTSVGLSVFDTRAVVYADHTVDVFDATTGQWSEFAFDTRTDAAGTYPNFSAVSPVALIGDKLIFEANSSYGPIATIRTLNLTTGATVAHTMEDGHSVRAVMDGKLVFAGGMMYDGGPAGSALVEVYDAASDAWSTTTLPTSIDGLGGASTVVGDQLLLYAQGNLETYDARTGATAQFPLPGGQHYADFTTAGADVLYAGGGSAGDDVATRVVDLIVSSPVGEPSDPSVADGAGVATAPAALSWSPADGATSYDVYLDDVLVADVTDARWTVDRALSPGLHSWQVVARDGTGDVTGGPRWQFTVGLPSVPVSPSVVPGAHLAASPKTLSWAATDATAASFDVYLDGTLIDSTPATSVTLDEPVAGGRHRWQVVARNAAGTVAGPIWRFTTPGTDLRHATTPFASSSSDVVPVTVGNEALFIPDDPFDDRDVKVRVYHAGTRRWSATALSTGRGDFAVAVVGATALVAGGRGYPNGLQFYDTVDLFDALAGTHATARLSQARANVAGVATGGVALFAGGDLRTRRGRDVDSAVVDLYDGSTHAWSTASLSQARRVAASVAVGTKVLFAGGLAGTDNDAADSDAVDVYDTATGRWSTAKLSKASDDVIAFAVGGRAYFTHDGVVDVYDVDTDGWSTVAAPSTFAANTGVAVRGRVAYFDTATDAVAFDTRTLRWSSHPLSSPGSIGGPVAVAGDKVLFLGGDVVDVLDTRAQVWSSIKTSVADPYGVAVSMGDTALFALAELGVSTGLTVDRFTDPDAAAPVIRGRLGRLPASASANDQFTVAVTLSNAGAAALPGPFTVDVYATARAKVAADAAPIGRVLVNAPLGPAARLSVDVP